MYCRKVILGLAVVALGSQSAQSAEHIESGGQVTSVTLYRGQALVQRTIHVEGPKGSIELVVSGLPEHVDSTSLFAEGGPETDVRAVRFRERAVGEDPRDEVRDLEEQIAATTHKLLMNTKMQELVQKQAKYLDGLDAFAGPTAKEELVSGTLDAEALKKVTEFSFAERKKILEQEVSLSQEASELQNTLEAQQRQLSELTNGTRKSVREAVVFLEKRVEAPQHVRLNYLVNQCGWSPTYTVRSTEGDETVGLEYNALIQQVSGEDWEDVALTLSTASPALSAAGPGLAPFKVALSQAQPQQGKAQMPMQEDVGFKIKKIYSEQQLALDNNRRAATLRGNFSSAWTVNGFANELQSLELQCDVNLLNEAQTSVSDGPTLSYTLDIPVSIASRTDQQIVRITKSKMASRSYHIATPVLSQYVFRETEVDNSSNFDLLGGTVQVYLNDRFVGRTELPTVARGQTFVVGFGADSQLRTRRELVERTDDIQGGNRELGFVYRLHLENFKGKDAQVRLLDRLPVSENNGQVRVSLLESGDDLSQDKGYQQFERPKGLLRWDVAVPAGAGGVTAKLVEYKYSVEYDRQYTLTAAKTAEQQQQEFEQLLRRRQIR